MGNGSTEIIRYECGLASFLYMSCSNKLYGERGWTCSRKYKICLHWSFSLKMLKTCSFLTNMKISIQRDKVALVTQESVAECLIRNGNKLQQIQQASLNQVILC